MGAENLTNNKLKIDELLGSLTCSIMIELSNYGEVRISSYGEVC